MNEWDQQLLDAVASNNLPRVKVALENGARWNVKYEKDGTPLQLALQKGHKEIAKELLEAGADPNFKTTGDWGIYNPPALHQALLVNDAEMVKLLLAKGADVNAVTNNDTPLTIAAKHGNMEMMRMLLEQNADVNLPRGSDGCCPLAVACDIGSLEMTRLLLEHGADPNIQANYGQTALSIAAVSQPQIVRLLLDHGADTDILTSREFTALDIAASQGSPETLSMLLEAETNPEKFQAKADQALLHALAWQKNEHNQDNIELLLGAGATLDAKLKAVRDAFSNAVTKNNLDMVGFLLDQGVNANEEIYNSITPLIHAASNGQDDMVRLLLQTGVDVDLKDKHGKDALFYAAIDGGPSVTKLLLASGADPNSASRSSGGALSVAIRGDRVGDAAMLLLAMGADPNMRNLDTGDTPLHLAAKTQNVALATALLACGANPKTTNHNRETPMSYKKENSRNDMMRLLKAATRGKRPSTAEAGLDKLRDEVTALAEELKQGKPVVPALEQPAAAELLPEPEAAEVVEFKEPKVVLGEHTRRLLEAGQAARAENDVLEGLVTRVVEDKFMAELIYRNGFGFDQAQALEGVGVKVEREYRTGPEPKWRVDFSVGENIDSLYTVIDDIAASLGESLNVQKTLSMNGKNKTLTVDFHPSLDEIVDAFNATLSEPNTPIDMTELRGVAKSEAQAKQSKTQNLGR